MRIARMLAIGAAALALVVSACGPGGGGTKPTVKVGSDGFYEAKLMAEIYAQALEAKGYTIERTGIGIGARAVSAPALESGQFDLKPEYLGGGLAFYDKTKVSGDPAAELSAFQAILTPKGITALAFSPAADFNAFVVTQETATELNLTKMSDLTAIKDTVKLGVASDCPTNPVCGEALKTAYGLDVEGPNATLLSACDTPMVQAIQAGTIDVGELCSTQPEIVVNNWVVLEDDKATQPAENIVPLVRNSLLDALGGEKDAFQKILNDVSAKLTTEDLLDMGKQINVDNKDIAGVAKAWLQAEGFVSAG